MTKTVFDHWLEEVQRSVGKELETKRVIIYYNWLKDIGDRAWQETCTHIINTWERKDFPQIATFRRAYDEKGKYYDEVRDELPGCKKCDYLGIVIIKHDSKEKFDSRESGLPCNCQKGSAIARGWAETGIVFNEEKRADILNQIENETSSSPPPQQPDWPRNFAWLSAIQKGLARGLKGKEFEDFVHAEVDANPRLEDIDPATWERESRTILGSPAEVQENGEWEKELASWRAWGEEK